MPFAHVHSHTFASVPRTATGVLSATCQREINAPGQGNDILPASDRSMTEDSAACDQNSCRTSACTNIHQDVLHRIEIERSQRSFTVIAAPAGVQRSRCFRKRKKSSGAILAKRHVMHAQNLHHRLPTVFCATPTGFCATSTGFCATGLLAKKDEVPLKLQYILLAVNFTQKLLALSKTEDSAQGLHLQSEQRLMQKRARLCG